MDRESFREEEFESRWEAAPAVVLVIALQLLLAVTSKTEGWSLWRLPWWIWLIPVAAEVALLLPLVLERPRNRLEAIGHRTTASVALVSVVSLANALLLVALLAALLGGHETRGSELLLKGMTVWSTNVIAFGLWYWGIDRNRPMPDFQFPQMENPQLAEPGWCPALFDYLYVSFTNSIAFSPTDAMPLSPRAKLLMLSESAISAITVLLVAARAVNILD